MYVVSLWLSLHAQFGQIERFNLNLTEDHVHKFKFYGAILGEHVWDVSSLAKLHEPLICSRIKRHPTETFLLPEVYLYMEELAHTSRKVYTYRYIHAHAKSDILQFCGNIYSCIP